MRKVVITGLPRSGTGYMCELMQYMYFNCGHEGVFKPHTKEINFTKYAAESSWCAVPWIPQLREEYNALIVFQIRNPLLVVRSLLTRQQYRVANHKGARKAALMEEYEGFIGANRKHNSFAFIDRHCPGVLDTTDIVERTCNFYVAWTQLAIQLMKDIPVEDKIVHGVDEPLLYEICKKAGYVDTGLLGGHVKHVLDSVSKRVNSHDGTIKLHEHLQWSDMTDPLRKLAEQLGFEVD